MSYTQQLIVVDFAGELVIANGHVGERHPLSTPEAIKLHAHELGNHTFTLTKRNTAGCIEDRENIGRAEMPDGFKDIDEITEPQLPGGLVIAATKAAVAADIGLIKDAPDFETAQQIVKDFLEDEDQKENRQEDGGHDDCGANLAAKKSAGNAIPTAQAIPYLQPFAPYENLAELADMNFHSKITRHQSGYFDTWNPQKQEQLLRGSNPQNFSFIKKDATDELTHGHNASSIYFITQQGMGFAKNKFIKSTGQAAFAVTVPKMAELAKLMSGSQKEEQRLMVAFLQDVLDVGSGLVWSRMPIFVQKS